MTVKHYTDVPAADVEAGAKGVRIRWVLARADGAPNFAMRHFAIAPGGHTPHHAHAWEHEVFILSGKGKTPLRPGTAVLVPPNEEHHFESDVEEPLTLLCLVPFYQGCPK